MTSFGIMVSIIDIVLLFVIMTFIFVWCRCRNSEGKIPTNWPIIGMIPGMFIQLNCIHDLVADILEECGGSFEFKGPWFANVNSFITCDPANIHHILSKKFHNFGKGPQFKKIFDALGDGIFISQGESWEIQRKTTHAILHHQSYQESLVTSAWDKLENGMIPLMDHVAKLGVNVDLQDLIHRFAFDLSCVLLLDYDPASLSNELPEYPLRQAFAEAEKGILVRHILPETVWRLQKWFQIGREKKLSKAVEVIDEFLGHQITSKREKLKTMDNQEGHFEFLSAYMRTLEKATGASYTPDKTLRDTVFNLIFAGKETVGVTLTWFFSLIAQNPIEESKIREEILRNFPEREGGPMRIPKVEELSKLIYLHGALCETLRLFPPVPFQHKSPTEEDILPSGHRLKPNTRTVLSFYSMGRMKSIWGKDCREFKPERWISERGSIKNVPSFKFTAFNAGPRSCLGKEISFIQLKMVAVAMIYHFKFNLVEGQVIAPSNSVVLHLRKGLNVSVSRRTNHP